VLFSITMLISNLRYLLMGCLPLLGLQAQEISGRWCVEGDPQDCYVLRVSGDTFQGESFLGNRKVADATGLYRNGRLAASFIRRDSGDVAVWIATMDSRGRLTGATLSPDGAVRWRGSYRREDPAPVTPAGSGASAASSSSTQAGQLGRVWRVTEGVGGPTLTWTRRGDTNAFDVFWNGSLAWVGTITINGNRVVMSRPGQGTYTGTLSADGLRASGTASWYPPNQRWSAVIEGGGSTASAPSTQAGQLGRLLRVTEGVGGPVLTWKRRGNTSEFDVYFANGALAWVGTVTLNGNRVTMVRPGQGTYTGTLSADGRSASGTASWYPSTQRWTAVIE
jgi:hypothetical protein